MNRTAKDRTAREGPPPVPPGEDRARILSLPGRAEEDLRIIRDTLARSETFTRISGPTVVALGGLGLLAAAIGHLTGPAGWWVAWGSAGAIGLVGGLLGVEGKARRGGQSLASGAGRRFVLGIVPPLVAGAILTVGNLLHGGESRVPGTWLLMYGVGLISAGATSVAVVRVLGTGFVLLGSAALIWPDGGDLCLALGFGGLHLGSGVWIWRRYGA